jgi:adenylate kinase family enzyme
MKHQLIMIEGLPGTGKTTTATLIQQYLEDKNINAACYLEGDLDHPVDYEGVAYFSTQGYQRFVITHQVDETLEKYLIKKDHGYFIYYLKYRDELKAIMSDDAFNKISQHDIYVLALEKHMEIILNRWERFVEKVKGTDEKYIFECCFLQNPVTTAMIRDNATTTKIKQYIHQISELIRPLKPLLIYLEQDDIEASFGKIINERSQQWQDFFIDYYTTQKYGQANDYAGLDGTIEILKDRQMLEKAIVKALPMKKLIIDNTDYDLDQRLHQLQLFGEF